MTQLLINEYAKSIELWRVKWGFRTPSNIDSLENRDMMLGKLMLVVTEVAEAAEAVRHKDQPNFEEELADTFIRLMDITAACNINIEEVIIRKMSINHQRPIKHGKHCSI